MERSGSKNEPLFYYPKNTEEHGGSLPAPRAGSDCEEAVRSEESWLVSVAAALALDFYSVGMTEQVAD